MATVYNVNIDKYDDDVEEIARMDWCGKVQRLR